MTWGILLTLVLALGVGAVLVWSRRAELRRMARSIAERSHAQRLGAGEAKLQQPIIDLSRCLGCATCVAVCPEDGVLDLVHGQAAVVNPARCVGVAACERECPVGAITVSLQNLTTRRDVPVLTDGFEAVGSPGLFLAGEVTAHALIKTAVDHGVAVAQEVARRPATAPVAEGVVDLCVVGVGPAGLACLLEARRLGLSAVGLEQESWLGGTVAKYPRRKLVMTLPVDLPLHGRLKRQTWTKEELIELWQELAAAHDLAVEHGVVFAGLERLPDGTWLVGTDQGERVARHVCLAIGRRGIPRRLGVPGEDLPKVAYALLDAHAYQNRRILVVGGGDSAVETALALAEQDGNQVTLSYRRSSLYRIGARNAERLEREIANGRIEPLYESEVRAVREDAVELVVHTAAAVAGAGAGASTGTGSAREGGRRVALPNDDVFIMAGGVPPFELLERSGVSFDPALRPTQPAPSETGTGLLRALAVGFALALATLGWALWHFDYYAGPVAERATSDKHPWLRPGDGVGLGLGFAAVALILVNLLYLVRRSPRLRLRLGSLQAWMTSHVATGTLALLCALLHGAMSPRDTPGGHAFWGLVVLFVSGVIGRYFYAYVPRAANGRELALAEVRAQLGRTSAEWDRQQASFRQVARQRVEALAEARQWRGSFVSRVLALVGVQWSLRRTLRELADEGRRLGVPETEIRDTLGLARQIYWLALTTAHYEDLRAILGSWRFVHRWVAALMVLLVVVHIVHALAFGSLLRGGGA